MQKTKNVQGEEKKNLGQLRRGQLCFIWGWIIIPIISWLVFFLYVNLSSFVQAFQNRFTGDFTLENFENFFKSISGKGGVAGRLDIAVENTMKFFFQLFHLRKSAEMT